MLMMVFLETYLLTHSSFDTANSGPREEMRRMHLQSEKSTEFLRHGRNTIHKKRTQQHVGYGAYIDNEKESLPTFYNSDRISRVLKRKRERLSKA